MYFLYIISFFIQESQVLRGIVLDDNAKGIVAAAVTLNHSKTGTYTNNEGRFEIKLHQNDTSIEIDHISYFKKKFSIRSNSNNEFILTKKNESSEMVTVIAEKLKRFKPLQRKIVHEKIEQTASANIQSLLNQEAGIDVNPESGIRLMGFDSEYTLILVDGQRVYSGDDGFTNLDIINLDNVEEVEIINGPSSFIYGRGALAGVVNIKSKKNKLTESAFSNSIKTAIASHNSRRISHSFRYNNQNFELRFNANLLQKDRYIDKIPSYLTHISPEINYSLTNQLRFNLGYRFTNERYQGKSKDSFNSNKDYNSDFHHYFFLTELFTSDEVNHKLNLSYNTRTRSLHEKADFENSFYFKDDDEQSTASLDYISAIKKNDFLNMHFGFGYLEESYQGSLVDLSQGIQSNTYLFLSNEFAVVEKTNTTLDLLVGGRIDKHNRYKSYFSPKIALNLSYEKFILKTEFGSGFKSPSFTEMYMSFDNSSYFVVGANEIKTFHAENIENITKSIKDDFEHLKPESNQSFSSSLTYKMKDLSFTNSYVLNHLENFVELEHVFTLNHNRKIYSYQNISDLYSHQYLSTIDYNISKNLNSQLSYRYLNIYDNSIQKSFEAKKIRDRFSNIVPEENYGGLFLRSKHVIKLNLNYSYDDFIVNGHLNWNSKFGNREKDDGNLILDQDFEYDPSYMIAALSIHYKVTNTITVNGTVNNLLNYKHDYLHYNGRQYSVSANYTF